MTQEELLNKILAEVVNVKETVKEVREEMATKSELQEVKSELLTHVDGFIKLHETLDTELVAVRSKVDRLETRLQKVELKLGIAEA